MTRYEQKIASRNLIRLVAGGVIRFFKWLEIVRMVRSLRNQGASIEMPIALAKGLNIRGSSNLVIGRHCSIQSDRLDTRAPVTIGSHCIVGDGARIITCSHDVDSTEWDLKKYGIVIEDYVWLATACMVLPSCRRIGRGAVIGAGSVVVKDVPPMAIVSGNPAQIIRYRTCVHKDRVVEEMLGGGGLPIVF